MISRSAAILAVCVLAACESSSHPSATKTTEVASAKVVGPRLEFVRAQDGDVANVVRAELDRAKRDGRRLLVYVGATWCEPCQRFHQAAESGSLDAKLPPMRFVEFDLDRDGERLEVGGYRSGYIPLFALPKDDGTASGRQIAGSVKGPGSPDEITPRLLDLLQTQS